MAKYTVHKGKRYAARIELTMIESFASNADIATRLIKSGFTNVNVTGSGSERVAHGTWVGEDTTADMPSQITEVKELSV